MLAQHAKNISSNEAECERQFSQSLEIVTAFLPVIGYDQATQLVQDFKKQSGAPNFRIFLEQQLGKELVDQTLSPQNLMALGYREPQNR